MYFKIDASTFLILFEIIAMYEL